jgi:hypothetical protein
VIPHAPLEGTIPGLERVEVAVATTEVHHTVDDRRRRLNTDLIVLVSVVARLVLPLERTGRRVERVEERVPSTDVDGAADDGRRGMHDIPGLELPLSDPVLALSA